MKKKKVKQEWSGYQEGLPTHEEAKSEYQNFYSDHSPVCLDSSSGDIKILSWNVLERDDGNGIAPNGAKDFGETTEQQSQRHDRIVEALEAMVKNHKVDFITLQEIAYHTSLLQKINQKCQDSNSALYGYSYALPSNLGEGKLEDFQNMNGDKERPPWGFGCITFFNQNNYQIDSDDVKPLNSYCELARPLKGYGCRFTNLKTGEKVAIHNVHCDFDSTISRLKKSVNNAFTKLKNVNRNFIVGDFNHTLPTLSEEEENITTSIAPAKFRSENEKTLFEEKTLETKDKEYFMPITVAIEKGEPAQCAWSIDGGFCKKSDQEKVVTLSRIILNPATAMEVSKTKLHPLEGSVPANQVNRISPVLDFDPLEKTQSDYLDLIRHSFHATMISVQGKKIISLERGLTLNNQKKFILTISKNIYKKARKNVCEEYDKWRNLNFQLSVEDYVSCIQISGQFEDIQLYCNSILHSLELSETKDLETKDLETKDLETKDLETKEDNHFINGIVAFGVLGLISAVTILYLELSGSTTITSNIWMFQETSERSLIGQDIILAVSALVILALISYAIDKSIQYAR